MSFVDVAKTTDIADGQMKEFHIEGRDLLVINYGGDYFVIGAKCPHMGTKLVKGKLEGKIVTCPSHGAMFDVTTGTCISGPKMGPIKLKTKDAIPYEVNIEGDSVRVKL